MMTKQMLIPLFTSVNVFLGIMIMFSIGYLAHTPSAYNGLAIFLAFISRLAYVTLKDMCSGEEMRFVRIVNTVVATGFGALWGYVLFVLSYNGY